MEVVSYETRGSCNVLRPQGQHRGNASLSKTLCPLPEFPEFLKQQQQQQEVSIPFHYVDKGKCTYFVKKGMGWGSSEMNWSFSSALSHKFFSLGPLPFSG